MICKVCHETILNSSQNWGYHRTDYQNARKDPEVESCTFCSELRADFLNTSQGKALQYLWTVRWLPATRQDQPIMAVTFRPQIDDDLRQGSDRDEKPPPLHSGAARFLQPRVFYLFKKDAIHIANHLGPTTNVTVDGSLPQIQQWLQQCSSRHDRCRAVSARKREMFLPTRLVDVGTAGSERPIHIIDSKEAGLNGSEPYVTLSHCWGEIEILRLVDGNKPVLMNPEKGIEWAQLTKTFQDAITVTRKLGVRYIWIDSLCIIQWTSESAHGDFKTEGQLMHKVYRNSFCNLAAADSSNGNGGLFRSDGARDKIVPKAVELRREDGKGEGEWYILKGDYWAEHLLHRILYTRGWVFQERMLAPRLLHFSANQVLWDCATLSASEVLPGGLPPQLDTLAASERHWRERLSLIHPAAVTNGNPDAVEEVMRAGTADDSLETFWRNSVRSYTRCRLTKSIDRLNAIWGVAKLVRDGLCQEDDGRDEEYGAGLWSRNLDLQLAWRVVSPGPEEEVRDRDLRDLYPSWSWGSTIAEIEVQSRHASSSLEMWHRVRSHDGGEVRFEVTPYTDINFQPVLARQSLAVKASIVKGRWDQTHQAVVSSAFTQDSVGRFDFFPDALMSQGEACHLLVLWAQKNAPDGGVAEDDWYSDCSDRDEGQEREEQIIHNSGAGLMLRLVGSDDEGAERYKRIGAFGFQGVHKEQIGLLVNPANEKDLWIL